MNRQLFGWSEQAWLYLDQAGIFVGNIMLLFSISAVITGWLQRDTIRQWLGKNRFPRIGGKPEGVDWQGLVFTVSRAQLPLWVAAQVKPKSIGLLVTAQSELAGRQIQAEAEARGMKVYRRMIDNADDPGEVHRLARELLTTFRQGGIEKTAVDITGGKVTMSLGAFMAAEEMSADSIYVTTDYVENKPDMRSAKIISVSRAGA